MGSPCPSNELVGTAADAEVTKASGAGLAGLMNSCLATVCEARLVDATTNDTYITNECWQAGRARHLDDGRFDGEGDCGVDGSYESH